MPQDRLPQWTTYVLVEHKLKSHRLTGLCSRRERLTFRQPTAKGFDIEMPSLTLLSILLRSTGGNVAIDFRLVFQVIRDDLVNQRQRQRRIAAGQHFGRLAFVIVLDDVIQPDPMPSQSDFPVRQLRQKLRKLHGVFSMKSLFAFVSDQ